MADYSNSVIYMIYCKDNNVKPCYVGSSGQLEKRKQKHKTRCLNSNNDKHNYYVYRFIRENGGWDNWEFRVLEEYPCDTRQQLLEREDFYMIQFNNLLNSMRAKRSKAQYRRDNAEQIAEKKKIQDKKYYENNKKKICEYQKEYKKNNREKFKKIIECECGSKINRESRHEHYKTKKHQNYINNK